MKERQTNADNVRDLMTNDAVYLRVPPEYHYTRKLLETKEIAIDLGVYGDYCRPNLDL